MVPTDIKPPGRPARLSDEQKGVLRQLVATGPDPKTDGVVRWRCVDLKRVVRNRFGIDLSEVSLGRVLKQLGFSRISARPRSVSVPVQELLGPVAASLGVERDLRLWPHRHGTDGFYAAAFRRRS